MPDAREQFIDSAVADFGDDMEKKLAAKSWMAETVSVADEKGLSGAIRRWKAVDARVRRKHREPVLLMIWGSICILLLFPFYLLLRDTAEFSRLLDVEFIPGLARDLRKWVPEYIPQNAKPHLFVREGEESVDNAELLWKSEPENPAYLAGYAVKLAWRKGLPPTFLSDAERLDPDNAWFDRLAAVSLVNLKFRKILGKYVDGLREPDRWEVGDPAAFEQAWQILLTSGDKSKCEGYSFTRFRERLSWFTLHAGSSRERLGRIYLLESGWGSASGTGNLTGLLKCRAWLLAEAGDTKGFQELLETHQRIVERQFLNGEADLSEILLTRRLVVDVVKDFEASANKLGFEDEARRFAKIGESERASRSRLRVRGNVIYRYGGILAQRMAGSVESALLEPPPVSELKLRPGRLTEHDQFARGYAIAVWTVLGICSLAVFGFRFRSAGLVRSMAARVEKLLDRVDWFWIIGGGVLLPVLGFLGLLLFSPIGGRDRSVDSMNWMLDMPGMMGRFAILAALLVILPVLVARWRLSLKAGMFGERKASRLGWWGVLCLLILLGISEYDQEDWPDEWDPILLNLFNKDWPQMILAGVPGLWLLLTLCKSIFSGTKDVLLMAVVTRVNLKSYISAMICMTAVVGGFHVSQQYWSARDHFMVTSMEEPEFPSYVHRAARQMRKETIAIWEQR
ncbi:hypothetical protein OVA24_03905 [Luteolibacter sp. SL250]|uniref:hypothetical protein n=1 Tax=Luteolibacter sp. SL250 TaxID=2995170 RepID=UPI00226D645E|nr:hypothetical protein [Luteolibacter sp. SL250]WAC20522.1 hypothetical protein OVA24_03905 [Luteolibacter sp. SL250]